MQDEKKREFTKAFGNVIKDLHQKSKRSARSISYETEISKTTLLLAQKGILDPQITTFCKLAEAYYITPVELLNRIYKELPPNWGFLEDN